MAPQDVQVEPAAIPLKMEPGTWEPKVRCPHAVWAQDPSSCSSGLYSYLSSHSLPGSSRSLCFPSCCTSLEHVTVLFIRREHPKEGLP